jgi:DNA-binding IclR family transcriptional regulator
VLGLFTVEQSQWTVEAAAKELELAVSTAYRYFRSLTRAGLLVPFTPGLYVLGPAIIQYDRQMRLLDPLITTAAPVMRSIVPLAPTHSLLLLCRLYRDQVMCVHQEAVGRSDYAVSYERGRPLPLFRGASSKVILAHLPMRTVRSFQMKHSEEMARFGLGADWEDTKLRLRQIRAAGICITQSELDIGLMGISAPLFRPDGAVIGSISLVLPAKAATRRVVNAAAKIMTKASAEIHELLMMLATGHHAFDGAEKSKPHRVRSARDEGRHRRSTSSKLSSRGLMHAPRAKARQAQE